MSLCDVSECVSVSALTPCRPFRKSVPLRILNLNRLCNMNYSSVNSRNEKVWNDYLSELAKTPALSLTRFLKTRHVVVHNFEVWMSRRGYRALQARAHAASLQQESLKQEMTMASESSFVPVVVHEDSRPEPRSGDILTGISLTLPDGTVISIRRGSAEAVVSFLKLYSGEGKTCSD